ncbi:MAG TPA: protein kinase [Thermoanaerobaculia bacterium]|nr:protein kinase [Thermoanaerobaculia bacterium]
MQAAPEERVLNHYRLLEKLGSGGMGQIWLALDSRLGRKVALKLLPPDVVADATRRKRFERESRALAALNHPNIVTIHSIEEADGQPFLVMEWIEGRTLEGLIPHQGLPLEHCLELAIPMVEAVAQAHRAGIVHRDLKPANVMVRGDGVVKVVDFGISKMEEATSVDGFHPNSTELRTSEGIAIGTLPYMSPQQLQGAPVDARSDIFSLGVVLYEMATGRRPFPGANSATLISAILRDPPLPFSRVSKAPLPEKLESLVMRCLAKSPSQRFQSAVELAEALKGFQRDLSAGIPLALPSDLTLLELPAAAPLLPTIASIAVPASPSRGSTRRRVLAAAVGVMLAALLAAGLYWRPWAGETETPRTVAAAVVPPALLASSATARAVSLAVLPLANLSGDPGQEYFSDGTTEAIIASLARIGGLRVTSRTSVMRFKNSRATLPEMARELGVGYILEGSLMKMADQVVITTQLVDASSDIVIWGDRFQGKLDDIFSFQEKVAEEVARATRVEVTGEDKTRLAQIQTVRPDVYETYLKARFLMSSLKPQSLFQALEHLDRVVAQEPGYALAWVARAECYTNLISPGLGAIPAPEGIAKAREAAQKAIELDPTLSDAHVVLGFVHMMSWDWPAAGQELRRAMELNPSNSGAYVKYSLYMNAQGHHPEAIAALQTARRLDPLSPTLDQVVAVTYRFAGQNDQAITAAKATLVRDPDFWFGHFLLGSEYTAKSRFAEADAELRKALAAADVPVVSVALGRNYARWGKTDQARRLLAGLLARRQAKDRYLPPTLIAKLHFALGENDQGFEWLQKALDERDQTLLMLKVDPDYAAVRSDARFPRLLQKVGLNGAAGTPR